MPRIAYMVIATLPDEGMAKQYIDWLNAGHVAAVIAGGASVGEVIRLESTQADVPPRVMSRYEFPSREAFDAYLRETAPTLRLEGLTKFGPGRGVNYQRLTGEVL
jgi:hypothetical protein